MRFKVHPCLEILHTVDNWIITNSSTGVRAVFDKVSGVAIAEALSMNAIDICDSSTSGVSTVLSMQAAVDLTLLTFLIPDVEMTGTSCPCCDQEDFEMMVRIEDPRFARAFQFVRCNRCGSSYLYPRPDSSLAKFYYGTACLYYHRRDNGSREYLKWAFKRSSKRRLSIAVSAVNNFEAHSVLDVGCGTGDFLRDCHELGWETWGIDLDKKALRDLSRSNQDTHCLNCGFVEAHLPEKYFSLLTFWSYLEHEPDQISSLQQAYRCLKPGGSLVIEVPDVHGRLAKTTKKSWPYWDPPFHVVHHGFASLEKLLDKTGFRITRRYNIGTSPYYFKYSPLLMAAFVRFRASYNSRLVDSIVSRVSYATLPFEELMGLSGKFVVVATRQ